MSPICSFLCRECGFEEDKIVSVTVKVTDCSHCEKETSDKIFSVPAQARGSFGTVTKRSKISRIPFKFSKRREK